MASRFQFSVSRLLAATTAIAVAVWPLTSTPSVLSSAAVVALPFLAVAVTVVGICQSRGLARTFFIGSFLPCLAITATLSPIYIVEMCEEYDVAEYSRLVEFADYARIPVAMFGGMAVVVGLLAVAVHRVFLWRDQPTASGQPQLRNTASE